LVEGNSVRAAGRIADAAKGTVLKLLADVGTACAAYQDEHLVNLPCTHLQCDEIWSFVGMKERKVPDELKGSGIGDMSHFPHSSNAISHHALSRQWIGRSMPVGA